ncbi:PDZ domain-containing protein [Jeotgalibacillus sp. S-D1]|uniref:SepM family pheromone-processing serine protease n=1 Tax=Jeotgalibacillus sp. S-D1 TaxID=2552189 RepID=UPI001059AA3A|nr:SepM family pheromone-processing serine protease [Jeotgalibacillus sp. S-D1]TDL35141.1 PDZ domain-containing protein [Jeotgalibacillus sp. S-D1]
MKNKVWLAIFLAFTLLFLSASFYTLPFYVQKPGSAFALDDIVEVDNSTESEGDFSLMTVSQVQANIFAYIWAKFDDYQVIYPIEQVRNPHESDKEYSVRQLHLMESSATQAIEVAFKKADADYSYTYRGIYVLNVYPDMPAEKLLEAGDRITGIDDLEFKSSEEFIEYVSKKKKGDTVSITVDREGEIIEEELTLKAFPEMPEQIGLGISLVDDKSVETDPVVKIDADEIGGPSAGLMYSLEIYDQLIEEDLTKGYNIAGTGTISSEGEVGRIGGIDQKIVAADSQGIDIFFAPDDTIPEDILKKDPNILTNYESAAKTAEDIGSSMKIVPVKTFDDALEYLESLERQS